MKISFGLATPIFRVADVKVSVDYYSTVLGFAVDWDEGGMVSVSRDRCSIMLTDWDQGAPNCWIWLGVNDVRSLFEEFVDRGARVRQEPTNFPWAFEMQIEDLDGNVLRIGSDPVDGADFGQFVDAAGKSWEIS